MKEIVIQDWSEYIELTSSMYLWGYRGQESAEWPLETSLHRLARNYQVRTDQLWHREYWMLRQFIRRAQHYCSPEQQNQNPVEWLALMQHYGAPTRLLDFSHSQFVAAFFALENATTDAAVWCLNTDRIRLDNSVQFGWDYANLNIDMINLLAIEQVNSLICFDSGNKPEGLSPLTLVVEPEQLHERLMNQQGFFLFPSNLERSVIENISGTGVTLATTENTTSIAHLGLDDDHLLKVVIPIALRKKILKSLESMNVNARTLFPGLDGFARSMKYHMSTFGN